MRTLRYPLSQLSHYPPIRQVTEELEGTATHLDSTLLTPFQSATPSRQLLGSSVKLALLLFSLLLPKHWVDARSYMMSFLANVRQKEGGKNHRFDRCPCVFLSLTQSCVCVRIVAFLLRITVSGPVSPVVLLSVALSQSLFQCSFLSLLCWTRGKACFIYLVNLKINLTITT